MAIPAEILEEHGMREECLRVLVTAALGNLRKALAFADDDCLTFSLDDAIEILEEIEL